MAYDHQNIEKKWQKYWEENQTFAVTEDTTKPKKYLLDMFPYPSGAGLHVGHPKGFTATDILARYYHATGHNVLHPMGFDAFGLPAENYAIKTGTHPAITTAENVQTFIDQLKSLGFNYDWNRMVDTTDPEYYKWTQWIFLELFKRGLAYEQDLPINYCPSCKTGLANEEVLSDNTCDRCGTRVERRPIRQWVLRITEYADRLLDDLEGLDWPEGIKEMQRNWIGRSEGCEFEMKKSDDATKSIRVYTTRVDTVYGMTYAVLAPDHPQVQGFITSEKRTECEQYIERAKGQSDLDRTNEGKEKTGVFTGSYVVNPFNGESVPLWIADYVLGSYGTGAVMAVPDHDERDWSFAKKYNLEIRQAVLAIEGRDDVFGKPYTKDGLVYDPRNPDSVIKSSEARALFVNIAETEGFGSKKVNYKLRDWLFSRQRYWGEPIPLIHITHEDFATLPRVQGTEAWVDARSDAEYLMIGTSEYSQVYAGINGKIIIDSNLPVTLPNVERYEPAGDGQSPLATVPSFVNVKLAPNLNGKRETNTMPQWGGSCWYYLRYMDNKNTSALAGEDAMKYWNNVDEYVGGAEHAVLHLLYARFWHKVLYDAGIVPTKEPFQKLVNQGMILAYAYERQDGGLVAVDLVEERDGKYVEIETGKEVKQVVAKMSKSLKNVVNPNEIVEQYGADTLRLYEMNMAGFTDTAPWNPDAIIGVRRFLDKAYATFVAEDRRQKTEDSGDKDMKKMKLLHKTVKKVGEDIVGYKFNTAISALMILLNEGVPTDTEFAQEWKEKFATLLHPFAPHMAEELYALIGSRHSDEGRIQEISDTLDASQAQHDGSIGSIYNALWPSYDEWMLVDDEVTIAIQINGKLRGTYTGLNGVMQDEVSTYAHETPDIAKWLEGKTLVKEIFIPNKMLSIVVKD